MARFALGLAGAALGLFLLAGAHYVRGPGPTVRGCLTACASAGERPPGALRVLTINVLHDFPRFTALRARLDRIAAEIRRLDADVVCVQEASWTPSLGDGARYLAERSGLNHVYVRANGERRFILFDEGEAVLSRFPLRDAGFAELLPRAGFFERRVVLHAVAESPFGPLHLFSTHLTNGDPAARRGQAASLRAFVEGKTDGVAIVGGDFNAHPDAPEIASLAALWIDTQRAAPEPTCCVDGLRAGPDEPLEERIDYLFAIPARDRRVEVRAAQPVLASPERDGGGWLWASDHVGLFASLAISESERPPDEGVFVPGRTHPTSEHRPGAEARPRERLSD